MPYSPLFRMPTPMKITGRSSTITNAFINAIIPKINNSEMQTTDLQQLEKDEIIKVTRKLERWITRPTQINSQILNSFLQLNDTHEKITIDLLRSSLPEINTFNSNLNQMSIIAEQNHAKVFELNNNVVEIWKPIQPLIDNYQNKLNTSLINLSVS